MSRPDAQERAVRRRGVLILGVLAVATGLVLNVWALGRLVADDGEIGNPTRIKIVVALQVAVIAFGVGLLWSRPAMHPALSRVLTVPLVPLFLLGLYGTALASRPLPAEQLRLLQVGRAEDLYLELSASFRDTLNQSAMNLALPEDHSRAIFREEVKVIDLTGEVTRDEVLALPGAGLRQAHWGVGTQKVLFERSDLSLWRGLFGSVDFFLHAKVYITYGDFLDDKEDVYDSEMAFSGLARMDDGMLSSLKAKMHVTWHRDEVDDEPVWRIGSWLTKKLEAVESPGFLFEETLDRAVREPAALLAARRSIHEEYVLQWFLDEDFEPPHEYFSLPGFDRQPGLAVVDVDGDGHDDLYVMSRWGANQLLRNHGDGTFSDMAKDFGLDNFEHTSAALFADFDNDGDPDAFLARTLERTTYLENVGGRFEPRPDARVDTDLPYLSNSISAADFDLDGMLDPYISTYAGEMFYQPSSRESGPRKYLTENEAEEFFERTADSRWITSRAGPPNVLLRNLGDGTFEKPPGAETLDLWLNSFQGTWSDFDVDGDPDVYVANDFAPNNMIQNEGDGRFTDITEVTATADIGFGMGVSWGDYDNDGDQDLYVTNMYSKAGRRITKMVGDSAAHLAPMARGNTLFSHEGGEFTRVSGLEPPHLLVESSGWSWGGQFVDVNNDGFLDLYALSGYYTAPDEVAIPIDT